MPDPRRLKHKLERLKPFSSKLVVYAANTGALTFTARADEWSQEVEFLNITPAQSTGVVMDANSSNTASVDLKKFSRFLPCCAYNLDLLIYSASIIFIHFLNLNLSNLWLKEFLLNLVKEPMHSLYSTL